MQKGLLKFSYGKTHIKVLQNTWKIGKIIKYF